MDENSTPSESPIYDETAQQQNQPVDPAPLTEDPALSKQVENPVETAEDPNADIPKFADGKLPGQEALPTLPAEGNQRGETPIVTE